MEINETPILRKITDSQFFFMIDNQVRAFIPKYEVGILLPLIEKVLERACICKTELKNYPIEGYYYKTPGLRLYFKMLRNLQMNESLFHRINVNEPEFIRLKDIVENNLFGRNGVYPETNLRKAPLKRKYDVVTLTMQDREIFDNFKPRPWTIDGIMSECRRHLTYEPNLVELGVLTKDACCVCAGAETNAAYRMYACISGCSFIEPEYIWCVSPEVEAFGKQVVEAYNNVFGSSILTPNIFNHMTLKKIPESPRVAMLGKVLATGENYFWILEDDRVTDRYTTDFITIESYIKSGNPINKEKI